MKSVEAFGLPQQQMHNYSPNTQHTKTMSPHTSRSHNLSAAQQQQHQQRQQLLQYQKSQTQNHAAHLGPRSSLNPLNTVFRHSSPNVHNQQMMSNTSPTHYQPTRSASVGQGAMPDLEALGIGVTANVTANVMHTSPRSQILKGRSSSAGQSSIPRPQFIDAQPRMPSWEMSTAMHMNDQYDMNKMHQVNSPVSNDDFSLSEQPSKLRKTISGEYNGLAGGTAFVRTPSNYGHEHDSLPDSVKQEWINPNSPQKSGLRNSDDFSDANENWETTSNSTSNRLALKQQPNFLQRKCYLNENRYLLPNPMIIGDKESMKFTQRITEGRVVVHLCDNNGHRIMDTSSAQLESTTGSLVKRMDLNDNTSFSLKLHCSSNMNRFRLRFDCSYRLSDQNVHKETIMSDIFQVHSNKSLASKSPKVTDLLPKSGINNLVHDVWIRGKDFNLKGVKVSFDEVEAEVVEITPLLLCVRAPARPDINEDRVVTVKVCNQFSNKLVNASEFCLLRILQNIHDK